MTIFPRRLNGRIILAVSCVLVATGMTTGWLAARREANYLMADMRMDSAIRVNNLAESCARYLLVQNYAELESYLLKSAELPDVLRLQVCEPDGTLVGHVEHPPAEQPRSRTGIARIIPPASRAAVITINNDIMEIWQPVNAGSLVGWLRSDFSLSAIREAQARTWNNAIVLVLVWAVCSAVLIVLVLRPIVKAINRLSTFARQLDQNKGAQIAVGNQSLELSELGDALNEASARLLLTEQQLLSERERLAGQKALLEAFFENTMTCNVILDREFNFIRVNDAYARADNRQVADFPGHNHFELYPSDARTIFEEVVATKHPFRAIARPFVFADHPERGTTYWDWTLIPILDGQGEVELLIFTLQNVTDRWEVEEKIRKLNTELEHRVQERTAELEERNAELARMNRLFVGRELRMIELKERISELEDAG